MINRFTMILIYLIAFIVIVDIYSFKGIYLLTSSIDSQKIRTLIYLLYWGVTVFIMIFLYYIRSKFPLERDPNLFKNFYFLAGFFLLFYLPKLIFITFHFVDDLIFISQALISKFSSKPAIPLNDQIQGISRAKFLTQAGLIVAAIPFASILYGMVKGRFNFRTTYQKLEFENLPKSFDGFKIVQISDIHIGSFIGQEEQVKKAIELVNEQNPDIILFTGDLVNNFSEELNGWIPILSNLRAKYGKFSILGNHDYGDYFEWNNQAEKDENLQRIIKAHSEIGFRLLLNESETIELNNSKIAIIGIENWGLPPFPQYGNLKQAMDGTYNYPFKILLSHDPSHWDAEVINKTNIDLTLSGHTHGMQFGIDIGNFKWSPVQYKYPRWNGLYQNNNQYLYVNIGLGYIGYPGRVGMPPEITVIELYNK